MKKVLPDQPNIKLNKGAIGSYCDGSEELVLLNGHHKSVEETYGVLIRNSPTPMYVARKGIFIFVNPSFQLLTGYSEEELVGKESISLVHLQDRDNVRNCAIISLKAAKPARYEFRSIRKNGEVRWVMESVITIPYEGEKATLGTLADLTEHKIIERALEETQNRYQTLFNIVEDAVYIFELDGRFIEVNNAACALFGRSRIELLKMKLMEVMPLPTFNNMESLVSRIAEKGYWVYESEGLSAAGKIISVEIHNRLIDYDNRKAIVAIARDISQRIQVDLIRQRNDARSESLRKITEFKTGDSEYLLYFTLEEALKLTESKIGFIYNYDEKQRQVSLNSWSKDLLKSKVARDINTRYSPDETSILGDVIGRHKPVILNARQPPQLLRNGYPEGNYQLDRYLAMPILREKKIVAVISVANKEMDYDQADVQQLTLLMNSAWNVVERWQAEEVLRESEQRYRQLFELSQDGILQLDAKGYIVAANPAAGKMFGYPEDGMKGVLLSQTYLPDEQSIALERLRQIQYNEALCFERQALRPDGTIFPIDVSVSSLTQGYFQEVVRDISERKRAEEQLRYQALLVSNVFDAIVSTDLNTVITSWNKAAETMFGWKQEEVIGRKLVEILVPVNNAARLQRAPKILLEKDSWQGEVNRRHKDGTLMVTLSSTSVIKDSSGKRVGFITASRDITERKKLEKELQEKEQKYRLLVENQTDFVTQMDLQKEYLFVNPAFCKYLGKEQDELLGKSALSFIHEEDLPKAAKNLENLYQPPFTAYSEHRVMTASGYRWVAWKTKAVMDDQGGISAFTSIGRDITESKLAKEELEQANERLKELDKMKDKFLSTVSHELRTPLTSIKSFAEILLNYDEDEANRKEFLGIINDESDRLTRLINDFLDLSKIQAGRMQWKTQEFAIEDSINIATKSAHPLLEKEKQELVIELQPDLPKILGDKDKMVQVITNLLGNAIKFTPREGKITIKAVADEAGEKDTNTITVASAIAGSASHRKIIKAFLKTSVR